MLGAEPAHLAAWREMPAAAGAPRAANLVLLGYAAGAGALFVEADGFERVIRAVAPAPRLARTLAAFRAGVEAAR